MRDLLASDDLRKTTGFIQAWVQLDSTLEQICDFFVKTLFPKTLKLQPSAFFFKKKTDKK